MGPASSLKSKILYLVVHEAASYPELSTSTPKKISFLGHCQRMVFFNFLTRQINNCIGAMDDKDESQNQLHVEHRGLKCRLGKICETWPFILGLILKISRGTKVYKIRLQELR